MTAPLSVATTGAGKVRIRLNGGTEDEWAHADMSPTAALLIASQLIQFAGLAEKERS